MSARFFSFHTVLGAVAVLFWPLSAFEHHCPAPVPASPPPPRIPTGATLTRRVLTRWTNAAFTVDKALAKAYAREEKVTPDEENSLNPFVLKVIRAIRRWIVSVSLRLEPAER